MLIEVDWYDIYDLVRVNGYNNEEAEIISNYIDDRINFEVNLREWLNSNAFEVIVDGDKEQALEYIKRNGCKIDECIIYDECNQGVFIDIY